MTKQTTPTIRFQGFDDLWVQRTLNELVSITMGQSPNSENYTENPTDHILVQGNADLKDKKVHPRVWTTQITKIADPGDIILSVRAPVGDVGKTDFSVVIGRGVAAIKGNDYIYHLLDRLKCSGFWNRYSTGSTFESISSNDIKNAAVYIPSLLEQSAIGSLFQKLDRLIGLHQDRLALMKAQKQTYLKKMFPQKGQKVPDLRFAGFTDEWEEKKLGEIIGVTMGQSPSSENYTDNPEDYILVQGNADIKNGYVLPRIWTTQVTKEANKGDLILSVRAPVGDVGKTGYDVVIGRGVAALKGNEFVFQHLIKMKNDGYWDKFSTGSTFESINSNDIKEAIIKIPIEDEQTAIGNFFQSLDKAIALQESKVEELKNLKKKLLQEMFV